MKIGRYLRITLISVVVLILAVAVAIVGIMQGCYIKKRTPDQLALLLTPYFKIKTPPGKGPYPNYPLRPRIIRDYQSGWQDVENVK